MVGVPALSPSELPPKPKRAFLHSNSAVQPTNNLDALPALDHLRGAKIVTVDCDGCLYDPWACCGHRGDFRSCTKTGCTHVRQDTVDWVNQRCAETGAVPVILSWRAGLVDITAKWLTDIGFDADALFIPGSADDVAGLALSKFTRAVWGGGQVQFKVATVVTLMAVYGCEVVGATDDNTDVCAAFRDKLGLGPNVVRQAPRLVEIADHEWRAGYLGAPKFTSGYHTTARPADGDWYNYNGNTARSTSSQLSLWDRLGATRLRDTFDYDYDDEDDGLERWGLAVGDRVKEPDLGIDGTVGVIVDYDPDREVVLYEDETSGGLYEADPRDLLVDDLDDWTPVALAEHPQPTRPKGTALHGFRVDDRVTWVAGLAGKKREGVVTRLLPDNGLEILTDDGFFNVGAFRCKRLPAR